MHPQVQQNPQLQTILQQQRLLQRQQHQQQIMQSLSQMQQGPITLQQQQQLRHHLQPQSIQSATLVKRPLDNGICSRRLMQYLYHQRHRSPDNSILYWRKFVAEYFAVRARKRWCLSLYDNMANNTLGVFPQMHGSAVSVVLNQEKDLILLWEFCTRRHEEFLPRRLLASQVNQLLQVAQKYQATVTENNTAGVSHQDLQASCNMFAAIGRQLARNFDLQSLNDLGFSKRYVRCLQISEVVSSMKDLIDFSQEQKIGAIESLKNYPRHAAAKLQKQKLDEEQVMSSHTLPGDPTTLKKATGIQAGLNNYINNNLAASQVANSSQQGVHALNSFQNMLRNTLNLKQNVLQEEALSSLSGSNHAQPLQFQGSASSVSIDASVSNLSGHHRPQPPMDIRLQQQYNPIKPQVNQHMQQHVIQQMLQEMMNSNKGASQQSVIAPNANAGLAAGDVTGGDITGTPVRIDTGSIRNALELQSMPTNLCNNGTGGMGSRSYSFQSAATASNPTISGNIINSRPDLPQNMGLPEMDHIAQEFAENGIFDADSW
ncbi:Transcriptional corepressor SEUSS [Musa troglodytarum]|uniref:Transcriptional corepressor SEUSS n=1 Tax=Musa troglodytarum TaxID=320322 RepID=A0A9E7I784_9LILI|nr:Transcriptional corepressor SEUSS [Musa troglodytarum]